MKSPLVHILILNWNGKENTLECLDSLKKIDYPNYKTIVIDNGSTDDSVNVISERFPKVKIIQNKKNLGYAEGNNVGIRYALKNKADYVLILNNDTVVDKKFLTELVKVGESDEKIGVVGPKVYHYGTNKIQYLGIKNLFWNLIMRRKVVGRNREDCGQFDNFTDVDIVAGCCTLIKSEVLKKIGIIDKDLFLYWEEVDLFQRAKKEGYKLKVATLSKIWHKGGATSKKISGLVKYYDTRNNFIFVKRYFKSWQRCLFLIKYLGIQMPMVIIRFFIHRDVKTLKDYIRGIKAGLIYWNNNEINPY